MLTPPNLSPETLTTYLHDTYQIQATQLQFLPLGADVNTAVYQITTSQKTYFLTALKKIHALRLPPTLHTTLPQENYAPDARQTVTTFLNPTSSATPTYTRATSSSAMTPPSTSSIGANPSSPPKSAIYIKNTHLLLAIPPPPAIIRHRNFTYCRDTNSCVSNQQQTLLPKNKNTQVETPRWGV